MVQSCGNTEHEKMDELRQWMDNFPLFWFISTSNW